MRFKGLIKKYNGSANVGEKGSIFLTATPAPVVMQNSIHISQEDELYKLLKISGQQILLYGDGGTGKTHMARNLFYRLQKDYERFAWIEYGTDMRSAMMSAFCDIDDKENMSVRFSKVIEKLTEKPKKTIIFIDDVKENAINDDVLARITGLGITIFITSRCKNIPPYTAYEIASITVDDCVELFYTYYPYDKKQKNIEMVRKLANLLNCNVMSIIMLARVIGNKKNLEAYYRKLTEEKKGLSEDTPLLQKEHIGNLLKIAQLSKEEYRILQCFALMPSGETPAELRKWFDIQRENIEFLITNGWINVNRESNKYILHDLIREHLQENGIPEMIFTQYLQYVLFDDYFVESDSIEDIQYKFEALERVLKHTSNQHPFYAAACYLFGKVNYELNKYEQALSYYQKALQSETKKDYSDPSIMLQLYFDMGMVFNVSCRYDLALKSYQNAEEYLDKIEDGILDIVSAIKNNIGGIYNALGNYSKALESHEKALEINEQIFGQNHSKTAGSYNNIGNVYNALGNYSKALEYHKKALEINEQVFGQNHPNIAGSYNNIGNVYHALGNYSKALECHVKALKIREQVLGQSHPYTADSYNNIGTVYNNMGDNEKALEYLKKALEIQEQVLGQNHPDTAISYNNIGIVYNDMGDNEKALEFHEKALEIREQVLGQNHPDAADSFNNIGEVLYKKQEKDEALRYHKKALSIREKLLGSRHIATAESYDNFGVVYCAMGKKEIALEYGKKALEIQEEKLPNDHPYIAKTLLHLSDIYAALGGQEVALQYAVKAYNANLIKLGEDHPKSKESLKVAQERFQQLYPDKDFDTWYQKEIIQIED